MAAQQIQPITYIIGINKLGTLLSSQTTDTPGTTTSKKPPWIAPEQLFKLTRFHSPTQIRVSGFSSAGKPAPPHPSNPKSHWIPVLISGIWPPAVTSSSLSPSRRLRKQYTHPTPTATQHETAAEQHQAKQHSATTVKTAHPHFRLHRFPLN